MQAILLLFSCLLGINRAQDRIPESGFSDQYKSENTFGEYTFGYNEDHTSGGSFRRETSDRWGNKVGSYGLRVGDGRLRIVNYVADKDGFRVDVFSNEPGVASQGSNSFSKITKKINMRSLLVPGFRYSSAAPHVVFSQRSQESGFDLPGDTMDGTVDEETGGIVGEGYSKMYAGEMSQGNNVARDFSEDFDEPLPERHHEPGSWVASEYQPSKDHDGEYGYDTSANMLQNQTLELPTVPEVNEVSVKAQDASNNPSFVAVLPQTDVSSRHGQVKYENGLKLQDADATLDAALSKTDSLSIIVKANYENGFNLPGMDTLSSAATSAQIDDSSRYGQFKYENGYSRRGSDATSSVALTETGSSSRNVQFKNENVFNFPETDAHGDLHPLQSEAVAWSKSEPVTAESPLNATITESRVASNETVANNVSKA